VPILAMGASAGGIEALSALFKALPRDLPMAVLVVLHRPLEKTSRLPQILARESGMPIVVAQGGEEPQRGICYIGTPDRHLTMGPDHRLHLLPDGFYRSHNIDALFASLARDAGGRTIGVILSGMLKDGSMGLKAIKDAGGIAFVQSPSEAMHSEMPKSAITFDGPIDFVGPVKQIANEIWRRTNHTPGGRGEKGELRH
jgi:two-component system chemotaxis response regulator CheB